MITETKQHLFEEQGLGIAPFKLQRCFVTEATCDSCGTRIKYNFVIEDSAGSTFIVGSTCVSKTGDLGLVRVVEARKASMVKAVRAASKKAKYEAASAANMVEGVRGRIQISGKPEFTSPYTDLEAMEKLADLKGNFPLSLYKSFHEGHPTYGRGLSSKQWQWVHKMACDAETKPIAPVDHIGVDASKLVEMFTEAGSKVKWPKLSFVMADGRKIQLSRAGANAKVPGSINVTDGGRYGENTWYGRIVGPEFRASFKADEAVREFIQKLAADPKKFAAECGVKTGCCCFCAKELTTDSSVAAGYGPVCAKTWGLPWGKSV
jgi:hypothetical protein